MSVYFAQAGESGLIKIGHSNNAKRRVQELSRRHHLPLRTIRVIDGGYHEEQWLHRHFDARRAYSEWFEFCDEMLTVTPPADLLSKISGPSVHVPTFHLDVMEELPLLRRYGMRLMRNADAADDLAHDVVVRAIERAHLFQPGTKLRSWLLTIMHNQYVNLVRAHARERAAVSHLASGIAITSAPDQMKHLEVIDLARGFETLSPEKRAVTIVAGRDELPYNDASKVLGIPAGTVKSRLSRARAHLRAFVDGEEVAA